MEAIKRPKSLTEIVLKQLRELIVSGELPLGSALSERQLAESLNVSKTPVREALAQLRTEDLVTIIPQKGAYVFTLSANEVKAICGFRFPIETAALELSFALDREALADEIDQIVGTMIKALEQDNTKKYLKLDTDFHAAFFRHCNNHYLSDSYERYVGKIAALRTHLAVKPLHTQHSLGEHIKMRDLLRNGTIEELLAVLSEHIARTRETYSEEVSDIAKLDRLGGAA